VNIVFGHEAVKILVVGVANGSGLKTTSIISHITPRVIFHMCTLITSDFDSKFFLIEICIYGGLNTTMWES